MAAASIPSGQGTSSRWLFGPVIDLVVGCGGFYLPLFLLCAAIGVTGSLAWVALLFPALVFLVSAPHYGATLLRVYERREDRQRYVFFARYVTVGVIALTIASLYSASLASWILTVYLTWSPWHYTGQNYGLAVMFLRRRNVPLDPELKRVFHATFVFSFLLTILVMHTSSGSADYVLVRPDASTTVHFISLGIPEPVSAWLVPLAGVAWLGALLTCAWRLLRSAPARDLLPAAMLVCTQSLWFTLPLAAQHWRVAGTVAPLGRDLRPYFLMWIAFGHAIQYLWVTTYFARSSARWPGYAVHYGKTLVAGRAAFLLPALLFTPALAHGLSFDLGTGMVIAAAVNLHHFLLDGAIWKLRSGRVASVLIRSVREAASDVARSAGAGALVRAAWAAGVVALVLGAYVTWQDRYAYPAALARGDLVGAARSLDRLDALGFPHESLRMKLGESWIQRNRPRAAARQFERSAEIRPTLEAWVGLGEALQRAGDGWGAVRAYQSALQLEPGRLGVLHRLGEAWLQVGRPDRALPVLKRAVAIAPGHEPSRRALARAQAAVADHGG